MGEGGEVTELVDDLLQEAVEEGFRRAVVSPEPCRADDCPGATEGCLAEDEGAAGGVEVEIGEEDGPAGGGVDVRRLAPHERVHEEVRRERIPTPCRKVDPNRVEDGDAGTEETMKAAGETSDQQGLRGVPLERHEL
jgi:hypothetical protein